MKIAIIGRGTSSIITALVCLSRGHSVEIFYDPKSPPIDVGESTTPQIGHLILQTLDICIGELVDRNICSFKNGNYFLEWGVGKPFKHHFNNENAFQFNTIKFNEHLHNILKEVGVTYHPVCIEEYAYIFEERKVLINGIKYDFLISCSGWKDNDEYISPPIETVNSAILFKKNEIEDPLYTTHRATKDGYQFELPFPKENVSNCGYLFNRKITDSKQIFETIKTKYPNCKKIEWNPQYCKKLIQNELEAYNGNRLFFIEPLQALTLHNYQVFANYICDFIENTSYRNFSETNLAYTRRIYAYFETIAYHYKFGSIYDSPFWEKIKKQSSNFLSFNQNVLDLETFKQNILHYKKTNGQEDFAWIGTFNFPSTKDIYEGMTGETLF